MKTATITQVKNQFSAYLDLVKHGETVLVLDRTVPVAFIEAASGRQADAANDALCQLERGGLLRRGRQPLPAAFLTASLAGPVTGAGAVAALLADREEGR